MLEQVNIPLWINEIAAEMEKADAERQQVLQLRLQRLYQDLPPATGVFELKLDMTAMR